MEKEKEQEHLQIAHARRHLLRRRWNKGRVAGAGTADPVLSSTKLTGDLFAAPSPGEQYAVHLPNQTQRKRKTLGQSLQSVIQGSRIIAHLPASSTGTPGSISSSKSRRSESDDRVPLIMEESTASLRTYI